MLSNGTDNYLRMVYVTQEWAFHIAPGQRSNGEITIAWRSLILTHRGGEVDLILTLPTGVRIPVEIKFGVSVRRAQLKSLTQFIENEQCSYGIVINNSDEVQLLSENIIQLLAGLF